VYVFDDTNNLVKIYIDGTEVVSEAETHTPATTSGDLTFGAVDKSIIIQEFEGFMDDVRLYNRVLSPTEVTELYEGTSKIQICKPSVGWTNWGE
jgi:hypothetical protein